MQRKLQKKSRRLLFAAAATYSPYTLAVTAFAARRLNVSRRRQWRTEILKGCNFLYSVRFPKRNVGSRIETILHIVLKSQVDRACFHARVPNSVGRFNKKKERKIRRVVTTVTTLCLKKVPTFKLSVTLSNLDRFSKFIIKKIQIFFANVEENANKLHFSSPLTLLFIHKF